ncbi:threonine--tRNA ligase [Halosimplex litoreum]|uniref:Threonine--tRNA ligase n=1 Tax=Halosimplex litoreum TaxID=1198301 RepID=A0A7U3WBI8_9EURY|nr:threonine--tRNA ligase [Halosimplex litoreum]QPV64983.1 threonine--tRNA ligase [Halosimplex litoreum]
MSQQESSITVELPDGSTLDVPSGATVEDVAYEIGPGLGSDTVAGKLDGELVAKEEPVYDGAAVEIVTPSADEYLQVMRHSAAHVLAQAILRAFPDAELATGPPTEEGFYYDFDGIDVDEGDFDDLVAEMEAIVDSDLDIEREEVSLDEARERVAGDPYKEEILEDLAAGDRGADDDIETVSFYSQGDFSDLCAGPHVASTGEIGAVDLREIAATNWRGDEDQPRLTRVYGTAFGSESDLEDYWERKQEAERRDHRRIGREMNLFSIPEHSPGCVHFHPDGMAIRRELEDYIRGKNDELGYEEVWTPELNKVDLWKTSGHYEHFCEEDEMFHWDQASARTEGDDADEYGLKPMNCANHVHLYQRERRSYRELPKRYCEFGTCYRNERSGELSGMLRVRGFTQDDGHAFVTREGIQGEVTRTLEVIDEVLADFGLDVTFKLETQPDDSFGDDELWERAEDDLRSSLDALGEGYEVEAGEGAFYGPKIAADAEDAIGREWTVGTVQLDFVQPERFDLVYVGEDNEEHTPVMIHRALLGTFERFMAVMIEHFAGRFPLWLAPEQVRVLPLNEETLGYAHRVKNEFEADGFRATVADGDDTLQRKIRRAHDENVPYMCIVGSDEEEAGTLSVRDRAEREARDVDPEAFRDHLRAERAEKRLEPDFLDE